MNQQERQDAIVNRLKVSKPYSENTSQLIEDIRTIAEDLKSHQIDNVTRAKVFSELGAFFSTLAVQELTK